MSISDIITLLIGMGTIVTAVAAVIISMNNNRLAHGQVEIQIRERITNARNRYEDKVFEYRRDLANISEVHGFTPIRFLLKNLFDSARDELLNSYDEACQKYLDGKVDKKRFEKSYYTEIRRIVNEFKDDIYKDAENYQALKKVSKQLLNRE